MEDVAQKITKRLYDGDKVKYEIILTMLYYEQKIGNFHEVAKYYLEGNLDEYIMCLIENLQGNADLGELDHKHVRESDMTISEFKKLCECLKDENILYLHDIEKMDKNSLKNAVKRAIKCMNK